MGAPAFRWAGRCDGFPVSGTHHQPVAEQEPLRLPECSQIQLPPASNQVNGGTGPKVQAPVTMPARMGQLAPLPHIFSSLMT